LLTLISTTSTHMIAGMLTAKAVLQRVTQDCTYLTLRGRQVFDE